jgi:hypothetical protein
MSIESLIKSRIRQDIVSMHAYAIQDSVGMVKLDAMENPHRLPADWRAMPTCLQATTSCWAMARTS